MDTATAYLQDLRKRKYPPELPPDIVLTLDDGSKHPVHKVVLAVQSEFFESLFTFGNNGNEVEWVKEWQKASNFALKSYNFTPYYYSRLHQFLSKD